MTDTLKRIAELLGEAKFPRLDEDMTPDEAFLYAIQAVKEAIEQALKETVR